MAAPDPSSLPSLVARIERAVGSDCTAIAAHPQALVLAGATRWRILEALLTCIHPDTLRCASDQDEQLTRVFEACIALGVCGQEDRQLVAGVETVEVQKDHVHFLERLVEMAEISESLHATGNVESECARDCAFLDSVVSSTAKQLFHTEIGGIFPSDSPLRKHMNPVDNGTELSIEGLKQLLENTNTALEEVEEGAQRLMKHIGEARGKHVEDMQSALGVAADDDLARLDAAAEELKKQMNEFSQRYATRFAQYVGVQKAALVGIGPLCAVLQQKSRDVFGLLTSIETVVEKYDSICKRDSARLQQGGPEPASYLHRAVLQELVSSISILEKHLRL